MSRQIATTTSRKRIQVSYPYLCILCPAKTTFITTDNCPNFNHITKLIKANLSTEPRSFCTISIHTPKALYQVGIPQLNRTSLVARVSSTKHMRYTNVFSSRLLDQILNI